MALFGKNFRRSLRHLVENYILALVIIAAAYSFAEMGKWAVHRSLSEPFIVGLGTITNTIFIFDGIFACGTTAIFVIRTLKKDWNNDDDEDE